VTALALAASAGAQTTYYLHSQPSSTNGLLQLTTSVPTTAMIAIQSADLKGVSAQDRVLASFDTQTGVPGIGGIIPASSTLTFNVTMRKTAAFGTVFPQVAAGINWGGPTLLCSPSPTNGTTAITLTTATNFTVSCTTPNTDLTVSSTDRIWVSIGYHMTSGPGNKSMKVELDIEGTTNPTGDSRVSVPNAAGPTISGVSPNPAPPSWPLTISGTYFGNTAGTVTFNGVSVPISSWTTSSIQIQVPAGAATGSAPIALTTATGRQTSTSFTVLGPPTLTSVTGSSGHIGDSVTIAGNNFMSTQSNSVTTSTVTFNGTPATPAAWGNTSITVPVPSGATTGNLLVTVSNQLSNTLPFVVIAAPTITSINPTGGQIGAVVTITGTNFGATQGTSTVKFNGTTATPSFWSNTAMTVPVPSGATTGNIVVTVAGQASNGLSFSVVTPGTISGTVTRVSGGTAISGATVQALLLGAVKGSATTIANGTYSISGLDPGTYEVWTTATGFSTDVEQNIGVSSSTTATVNVAMSAPGSVSGQITQNDGVTPIVGASVSLYSGSSPTSSTNTNGTGNYTIAGVHTGSYAVRAANAGYRTKEQSATVTENTNTVVNLSLDSMTIGTINYVYDEFGRLVQVTDQSGDSATYEYDLVGNVLKIVRGSTTATTISEFTPNSGPVGTTVTIYGTGFSTTPTQNTVTFGGATATVSTATTTTLVVTASAGGTIAVTSPNGSATSADSFTVSASAGPTITGFSPSIASTGTTVSVTGTNFNLTASNDRTSINTSLSYVSAVTATTLTTAVPSLTGSGPITVATPLGSAVSTTDLFVPPAGFVASDVVYTGRIGYGDTNAVTVSIGTATKIGLVTFVATAGQRISLLGTNGMSGQILGCDVNVSIYRPDNTTLVGPTCMEGTGFIDATTIAVSGTYTILVDPTDNATGSVTLSLYTFTDLTGTIAIGGSAVTKTTDTPGQNATLTFSGTSGERISVWGTNGMSGQIFGCDVNVSIVRASDNVTVASPTCMEQSGFIEPFSLPTTGSYNVFIDPAGSAKGSLTVALYNVTDINGSITADGTAVTASIGTPGQNAYYVFTTTVVNQRVSLNGTNGTMAGQVAFTCDVNVSIVRVSDGHVLASPTCMEGSGFIDTVTLPTAEAYNVFVDPNTYVTGNLTLQLYTVTDFSGTITADGTPVTASIGTPGQNAYYMFTTTVVNQRVSLNGTNGTMAGQVAFTCDVNVSIVRVSDGHVFAGPTCMEGSGFIDTVTLPSVEAYNVFVDPTTYVTGNLTLQLYAVPADLTGTLTVNAAATPVSLQTPGQNASYTFTLASSQTVTVRVTNNTFTGTSPCVTVSLVGGSNPSSASCGSSFNLAQQTLGAGTYTVNVDPSGNSTGSLSIQVTSP
jgi:YD repeat-containing protein